MKTTSLRYMLEATLNYSGRFSPSYFFAGSTSAPNDVDVCWQQTTIS